MVVQLRRASAVAGYGLQLMFNPDEVLKLDIAYHVMAHYMRTGSGFTNRHDKAVVIAGLTRKFAVMLQAASSPTWEPSCRI